MSALRKVLVVDDDPVVGKSFDRVLSSKGYEVVTAQNAAEALERIRQGEYDMVYTDIRMPARTDVSQPFGGILIYDMYIKYGETHEQNPD